MARIRWRGSYPLIAGLLIVAVPLMYSTQPVVLAAKISRPASPTDALLQPSDFYHLSTFVKRLAAHKDPIAAYTWSRLSAQTQQLLTSYKPGAPNLANALAADLNSALHDPNFYSPDAFAGMKLRGTTQRLLKKRPPGERLIYLNRALIENAYPGHIKVSLAGKVFDDDADQAQAQADDAQAEADQSQAQADQAQGEQQQADQQQADEQQAQADQQQGQADQLAEAAAGQQDQQQAADKGWTWGDFFANIVGGAVGGFLGGLSGGIVGGLVGALGGAVGGALVSVLTWAFGSVPATGIAFRALPQRALD